MDHSRDGAMRGLVAGERLPTAAGAPAGGRSTPWWLVPNLLALDAPLVAVVWLSAFAHAFGELVEWPVAVALFAAVWCVYLVDRLIDAWRMNNEELATARHVFARRHRGIFLVALVVSMGIGGWLAATRLEVELLRSGLVLVGAVGIYFGGFVRLFRGWRPLPAKEVVCGLVFAVGCALGVEAVRQSWMVALPAVLLFGGVCALNCLAISAWEKKADRANDVAAAGCWWRRLDADLPWLGVALMLLSYVAHQEASGGAIFQAMFVSCLGLTTLHLLRGTPWMGVRLRRVLADAVLLTPLLLV